MIVTQLSKIANSLGLYASQVSAGTVTAQTALPSSVRLGAGYLPAGLGLAPQLFLPNSTPSVTLPNSAGQATSTPDLSSASGALDYNFDAGGNLIGANSPAIANMQLCLAERLDSTSVEGLGLQARALIPLNYQNVIANNIKRALQPVVDAGLAANISPTISKRGSTIMAKIDFTDLSLGGIANTYHTPIGV